MAITSEIIGKLGGGGAEVEVTPVSGTASGHNGSQVVIATVDVPAGETWLVAVVGTLNPDSSATSLSPYVYLGNQKNSGYAGRGDFSMATLAEGEITFRIRRNTLSGTDRFTGHVYTVKL